MDGKTPPLLLARISEAHTFPVILAHCCTGKSSFGMDLQNLQKQPTALLAFDAQQ